MVSARTFLLFRERAEVAPAPVLREKLVARVYLWIVLRSRRSAFRDVLTPRERLQEMLPTWPSPGNAEWRPVP